LRQALLPRETVPASPLRESTRTRTALGADCGLRGRSCNCIRQMGSAQRLCCDSFHDEVGEV